MVESVQSLVQPELSGPVGEPSPEAPLNINSEINIQQPKAEKTIVCWNCLSVLIVKDNWNVVECSECHKLNRVPHDDIPGGGSNKMSLADSYNHFDVEIPYIFGIVVCPFCRTENRFRRDANHVVCFKCHHSFNVRGGLDSDNNKGVVYNFPTHDIYRFSDLYPDIIQYRGYYPQPLTIPKCNCNETELMLQKILKTIKKKNEKEQSPPRNNIIPYPMYNPFLFMNRLPLYDDYPPPRREYTPAPQIHYIPYKPEPERERERERETNQGFKITIRKKSPGDFGASVSKSAAFEKIFYTK